MKILTFILLIITSLATFGQQESLLSQYQFNQLQINPAYTGVNNMTSVDLQYRQQWAGLAGAPQTAMLSGQTSLMRNALGIGCLIYQDKVGVITNTSMGLAGSYKIYVDDGTFISFGLQSSWHGISYDYDRLTLEDQTDEDFVVATDALSRINFGTGLFLSSRSYYLGASIPRLLKVEENENGISGERFTRHYYFTAGIIIDPAPSFKLKPYAVFRLVEDGPYSYDLGANVFLLKTLWVGAFTRDFSDFGVSLYLQTNSGIRIGYSGELTTDELVSAVSSHEISLGIDFKWFEDQELLRRDY